MKPVPSQLSNLFSALQAIQYVHWKSNQHLSDALQGKTDLDLLIAQGDAQRFRQLILQHGFKSVISPPRSQFPAMEDYLGFDPQTGKLFHLHVHYQLVLGEQYVKNYRLPLEDKLLSSASLRKPEGIMVPAPEWELVMLLTRALLKTRDRDLILALLGRPIIPKNIQDELTYLADQIAEPALQAALSESEGVIPREPVLAFLRAWQADRLSSLRVLRLRHQTRRSLAPYQRHPRWKARLLYFYRLWQTTWPLFVPWVSLSRKRMPADGTTVAIVGADGAGKTSLVAELKNWLSWKLEVKSYYLGSQKPTLRSRILGLPVLLVGFFHRRICLKLMSEEKGINKLVAFFYHQLQAFHFVSLGHDRYRRYLSACRAAKRGSIVLFDRYPLKELDSAMDKPYIKPDWGGLCPAFSRVERRYYAAIKRPDHVIALHVSDEVALARKPEHKPAMVQAKTAAMAKLREQSDPVFTHLNADRPAEQVALQAKRVIWGLL